MAVAEKRVADTPATPRESWVLGGLVGAVYILAGLAVVAYGVPALWVRLVGPDAVSGSFVPTALRLTAQLTALLGLGWLGQRLAGDAPRVGLRAAIVAVISVAFATLFTARAAGRALESSIADASTGLAVLGGVSAGLFLLGLFVITRPGVRRFLVALEEQGWFHLAGFKPAQGQLVRRLTILGFLVLLVGGVYTLSSSGVLNTHTDRSVQQAEPGWNDWTMRVPFTDGMAADGGAMYLRLLPDLRFAVPLLLVIAAVWFSVRLVNVPAFADFLIATEAEMNKVSWPTRSRLVQDTIVVMVMVLILTVYLLLIDLIWGTLLTWVKVLPKADTSRSAQMGKLDW